jgi:hypothetical protein
MPSILLPNALFQQWKPGNAPRAIRPAGFDRFRRPETGTRGSRWRREQSCPGSRRQWTISHGRPIQHRAPSTACRRSRFRDVSRFVPVGGPNLWTHLGSKLFETVAALASADGHLPDRARKAIRFGPPRLASPGFVKKLRHAGIQCYGKAAQRVDPNI